MHLLARSRGTCRALAAGAVATVVAPLTLLVALGSGPAQADTAPTSDVPATVTAAALPTVQVNGVVWAQVIVGGTVYVTGEFTSARPAGAALGTNETPRSNILAYDLATGALKTSWAPSLNAQGLAIAASADGSKIIVAGDFTTVNGANRYRIAELDAVTGALVTSFTPGLDARARALAVVGDTVYVGGIFTTAAGQARNRLAALSVSTGAVLGWAPGANAEVMAMTAPPGTDKIVVGGRFTTINGSDAYGLAAVDASSGALLPWAATATVRNAGTAAAITSLHSDATQVYGTGYTFGAGGNLEGTFAAASATGEIAWINDCKGDSYDSAPIGGVLYWVSHSHNCGPVGGNPEQNPRGFQRALATTTAPAANGQVNTYQVGGYPGFVGQRASQLLHWLPTLTPGSYTGQTQAAWTVTGNSDYVVLGGEFPKVNGVAQQGLVRFAVKSVAPDKEGPQGYGDLGFTVSGLGSGTVRATFKAAWDRDNARLTYELLRGDKLGTATVVASRTLDSNWWTRPALSLLDTTAAGGSTATYRLRIKDVFGNALVSPPATVTVPAGAAPAVSTYAKTVLADGATEYWRLGETSGSGLNSASPDDLTLGAVTRGTAGAIAGDADPATTFAGTDPVPGTTTTAQAGPQLFTEEAWFATTTTTGGKILGFGNSATGVSGNYDRHLYLTDAGNLVFGIYDGTVQTVVSPKTYNDGAWHHVAATLSPAGIQLYVDGALVGSKASAVLAQLFNGYWRVGGDNLSGWTSAPSTHRFAGAIDEVAIYPTALSAAQIAQHHALGVQPPANQAPTAAFSSAVSGLGVALDGTGSLDADGSIASYAWDFGDGSTGTGATASHSYAADGTYQVTLTVTDNAGATGAVTHPVTVTSGPAVLAADSFGRTVSGGLGAAETGGAWTVTGAGTTAAVDGSAASLTVPAGRSATARLSGVSSAGTDLLTTFWLDQAPSGGGVYLAGIARGTGTGDYRARLKVQADGTVLIGITKVVSGAETLIGTQTTVPGVTVGTGTKLDLRVQATGSSPTTVRARVWPHGTTEPSAWQQSVTDSTAGLQESGSVGVYGYLSGTASVTPVVVRFDDLRATTV
ncbi:MAG TPA: LamG-like jellyroll fold domain-containing protein [Kineosporiaceae bacterium]|nr:LamG-like jellyroll fold domain-containing protein [Kineosporiaceae bacterium]